MNGHRVSNVLQVKEQPIPELEREAGFKLGSPLLHISEC